MPSGQAHAVADGRQTRCHPLYRNSERTRRALFVEYAGKANSLALFALIVLRRSYITRITQIRTIVGFQTRVDKLHGTWTCQSTYKNGKAWVVNPLWLLDSASFNEWMNELDYRANVEDDSV